MIDVLTPSELRVPHIAHKDLLELEFLHLSRTVVLLFFSLPSH